MLNIRFGVALVKNLVGTEFSVKNLSEFIGKGLERRDRILPSPPKESFPLQKQIHFKYLH